MAAQHKPEALRALAHVAKLLAGDEPIERLTRRNEWARHLTFRVVPVMGGAPIDLTAPPADRGPARLTTHAGRSRELLGHQSVATTERYTKVADARRAAAVAALPSFRSLHQGATPGADA